MQELITDADKWYEAYEKLKGVDEVHDFLLETMNFDLSEKFTDESDWGGLMIDFLGDLIEQNKDYEKGLLFLKKYAELQPKTYKRELKYYESYIVDYQLFNGNIAGIDDVVDYYYEDASKEIDEALTFQAKIQYWNLTDAAYRIAKKNYKPVTKNPDFIGNPGLDYAVTVYTVGLQEAYENYLKTGELNLEKAKREGEACEVKESAYTAFEESIHDEFSVEKLTSKYEEDRSASTWSLRMYFYQYMHKKGISFGLSGLIWQDLMDFCYEFNKGAKSFDSFFRLIYKLYNEHLSGKKFLFFHQTQEICASLWGVVFAYDFLFEKELISEKIYLEAIKHIEALKFQILKGFHRTIWTTSYIHKVWTKPDGVTQVAHDAEKEIFEGSFGFIKDFDAFKAVHRKAYATLPNPEIPRSAPRPSRHPFLRRDERKRQDYEKKPRAQRNPKNDAARKLRKKLKKKKKKR